MKRLVLVVLFAAACSKPNQVTVEMTRTRTAPGGKKVATFNRETVTDQELLNRFAEMSPYARARYQTVEQKKEYLDGVVRFELLAQEAVRRGIQNDPEVVEAAKKVMVQALLKQELEGNAQAVPEGEVGRYYETHKTDYVKPAMTRLSHIFFKTEHKADADETLKAALALAPLDYAAFAKLAREKSEDPRTQPLEGDMRFLSDDELSQQYGAELVAATKEMNQVGTVLPHLVQTKDGYHVVKLQGRQVALNLGVDQVKTQIQTQLTNETKMERYRALLDRLKEQSKYTVDEAALAAMEIDVKAPAAEPKGPTPGFLPPPEPARQIK